VVGVYKLFIALAAQQIFEIQIGVVALPPSK